MILRPTLPGQVSTTLQSLSICHWNLNSIRTENFIKIPILQASLTDVKRGGVCINYKNHLPLTRISGMSTLKECLFCELKIGKKILFIVALYSNFKIKLEQTIINIHNNNPYISIFISDFNARNANWWA